MAGGVVPAPMRGLRLGSVLSLVRQGIALEVGFGTRSIEALLWVAEAVEEAVYAPGSLELVEGRLRFTLMNPPLRAGAFSGLRAAVNGRPVVPAGFWFRSGAGTPWRTAASVGRTAPFEFLPGRRLDFAVDSPPKALRGQTTVRLELESVAIPPMVWVEFSDEVRAGSTA
jgi:hypothetical protein